MGGQLPLTRFSDLPLPYTQPPPPPLCTPLPLISFKALTATHSATDTAPLHLSSSTDPSLSLVSPSLLVNLPPEQPTAFPLPFNPVCH